MHYHPVWLIEVEEDLFITPFIQLYQSTRMMMPLHILRLRRGYHRNTSHQTQSFEENWDLTLQMIWFSGMLYHPVWLIEVEEDLFLNSFIQLYQSTRMMTLHLSICNNYPKYHRSIVNQFQWIEEKWDLTLQMIRYFGMHYHPVWLIEVEEDLFLTPFIKQYQSTRMMVPNWSIRHQSLRFQALPTLSIQTTSLIGMPYSW